MTRVSIRRGSIALGVVLLCILTTATAQAAALTADTIGVTPLQHLAPELDGVNEVTGNVQRVAIIDSGLQGDHPGFADRVVAGINFAADAPRASTQPADYTDHHGHGTFVGGIIGSSLPDVPGLVPNVELVSVRVLNSAGDGSFSDIATGLEWVRDHATQLNISAVNISLGSGATFASPDDVPDWNVVQRMRSAMSSLKQLDVVTVAAGGNGGETDGLSLPGIMEDVIAVGASDFDDNITDFSNRNDQLELLAPGTGLHSLWKNDATALGSGSSYATPVVAGAAVLLRDAYSQWTSDLAGPFPTFQDRLVDLFQRTGQSVLDPETGLQFHRIDAEAAVRSAYGEFGQVIPEPASMAIFLIAITLITRRTRAAGTA